MTSGIHHLTGITANVQANVDFYVGFLGLRLVKRTGGFADADLPLGFRAIAFQTAKGTVPCRCDRSVGRENDPR